MSLSLSKFVLEIYEIQIRILIFIFFMESADNQTLISQLQAKLSKPELEIYLASSENKFQQTRFRWRNNFFLIK